MAQGDALANSVSGGADAVAAHINIRTGGVNAAAGSVKPPDWPIGTNAFPSAFGVYDPVAKENLAATTGLDFGRDTFANNWNDGTKNPKPPEGIECPWISCVLQATDFDAGKTDSFTVEFFVRTDPTYKGKHQVLAAMPVSTGTHPDFDTTKASWSIELNESGNIFATICTNAETAVHTTPAAGAKIWDDRWHHIALTIDGKNVKLLVDYTTVRTATLKDTVKFSDDGHLFIGGTTHTIYSYAGSMAHFRVSNTALTSDQFLHFTRTVRAADEPEDVVLHLDFEPVDGLSTNQTVVFNRAATGSAVHLYSYTDYYEYIGNAKYDTDVYTNTLYSSRTSRTQYVNTLSFSKTKVTNNRSSPHLEWYPDDDIFHDYPFTIEMFLKTTEKAEYKPYLRRRTGTAPDAAVQLTIGTGRNTTGTLVSGFNAHRVTAGATIADGEWHHWALVYDKTNKKEYMYRDWKQTGNVASVTESNIGTAEAHPIVILGDPGDNSSSLAKIDDVRITKRALGVKEFLSPVCSKGLMIAIQ